jgi:lipoprotein-releasing system permease protein
VGEADLKGIKVKVDSVDEVKSSIPFVLYSAILGKEDRLQPVTVKAVDYGEESFRNLIAGYLRDGTVKDLIVGKGVADVLGVSAGDKAVLIFPTGIRTPTGFIPKTKEVRIGGVFYTGAYDRDFVIVYMDRKEARKFFKRGFKFEGIEVYIEDPYRAQEVKERLQKAINNELVLVRSWIDLNKPLFNALQLEKLALFLILLLMVLVASFNITSLLFVKIKEKIRDIAVLKTFGMQSKDILKIFVSVGLSIGFIGAFAGVITSFVLAYFINEYELIRVPEEVYMMSHIPVHIKPLDLVATFIGTLILSFLSSLIPALRASREDIVSILRNE